MSVLTNKTTRTAPSPEEVDAYIRKAHKLRSEAVRDMFAGLGRVWRGRRDAAAEAASVTHGEARPA